MKTPSEKNYLIKLQRGLCRLNRLNVQAEAMLAQGLSCKRSFVFHGNMARLPDEDTSYYPNLARLQA
jgi:hypothetical protein